MDPARFDALARSLVGSRRATLRALAGAALGAGPARLLRAADAHHERGGRGAAGARRRPPTTCKVEERAGNVVTTFTTRLKKLGATTIVRSPLFPLDDATSTTTIKRGRAVLVRTEETRAPSGQFTYRTTYGAGFAGIDEIVLVVDGGTIGGEVDGRALVPFPATDIPDPFAFQDGQPAPELRASEATKAQIKNILERAAAEPAECAPAPGQRERDGREGGVHAQGGNDGACLVCKGRVFWESRLCESGVYEICSPLLYSFFFALGYAGCMAAGIYDCNDRREDDLKRCRESQDCCPVRCGDLPDWSCCRGGRQCLTPSSNFGVCCEPGFTACHARTCCSPGAACRPDGLCCPRGTKVCGDANCCPTNQTCCGPLNCCPPGEHCLADGTCCRSAVVCNGVCCDSGVCCQGVCCADGDFCDGPTGRCARTCQAGDHICPAGNPRDCCGPASKCCNDGSLGPGGCCDRDLICCSGKCLAVCID